MVREADAVIICGGLGPTHDDLTREAIASVMGVDLVLDDDVADVIRHMFSSRNRPMPENNLRQAMVPVGAQIIEQTRGTAPGLICPVTVETDRGPVERVIYAVPGVPHELRDMFERAILPDLQSRSGEQWTIASRTLRTWGESESGLNERLDGVIADLDRAGNPTLAFLASGWEGLKVRLTARAEDRRAAEALLLPWEERIRSILGSQVFGVDDQTMESVVLSMLADRGWTLGVAESVTGGLVTGRLTAVPGASKVRSSRRPRRAGRDRGSRVGDGARCAAGYQCRRWFGTHRCRRS
jgi:nicotinamide-nucleotide amidase